MLLESFDQRDLARKVRRIERLGAPKLAQYLGGDSLVLDQVNPPMNHTMPNGKKIAGDGLIAEPIDQVIGGVGMIGRGEFFRHNGSAGFVVS
jgi:hypothetical protein